MIIAMSDAGATAIFFVCVTIVIVVFLICAAVVLVRWGSQQEGLPFSDGDPPTWRSSVEYAPEEVTGEDQ